MSDQETLTLLRSIASSLERLAPTAAKATDLSAADAFVWQVGTAGEGSGWLEPVPAVSRVHINLLQGIDSSKETLLENTRRFAKGLPANNALLWGARGTGKSSLVKAAHAAINEEIGSGDPQGSNDHRDRIALIELHREDLPTLPQLLSLLRAQPRRCILFCDDLSFDAADTSYKSLKAVLEGGIEGRPANVIFYATSNRRHLLPRDMIDNERSTAINPSEAVEEKVSLSDRFGLWIGFHNCDQDTYFAIIEGYAKALDLPINQESLRAQAVEWSMTRGARSGRVAWQFIQDLAGRLGKPIQL